MTEITARLLADDDGRSAGVSEEQESVAVTAVPKKKRVLIYGINYAPEPIGVGRYTGELGAYLSQQGVEVEVVTAVPHYPGWALRDSYCNRYKIERIANARVTRCPLLLRANTRGIWRVLAPLSFALSSAPVTMWRILTFRPDTVLCVEPTLFAAPVALLFANLIGARTILHVQDLEIDAAFAVGHMNGRWLRAIGAWFERIILSRFDSVVTISNRMRERLRAKGVKNSRLSVIRNWVDLDKIKPLAGPSKLREDWLISTTTFVALYSGNIGPKQALPLMLEAAALLADHPDVLFVVAGEGPEKRLLMQRYGHLSNVRFLPLQPEEMLCELLNLADVHILPQHRDTADLVLPSKLGGMLASGKACIVMAERGTEMFEFLSDAAILVEPGDSVTLADAILALKSRVNSDDRHKDRLSLAQKFRSSDNLQSLLQAIGA